MELLSDLLNSFLVRDSFKFLIKSKKERIKTMVNYDNLLIGSAFMIFISFIILLFYGSREKAA